MNDVNDNSELINKTKALYNRGSIDRETAKLILTPFINMYNEKAKKTAKKYNIKPKLISFASLVR